MECGPWKRAGSWKLGDGADVDCNWGLGWSDERRRGINTGELFEGEQTKSSLLVSGITTGLEVLDSRNTNLHILTTLNFDSISRCNNQASSPSSLSSPSSPSYTLKATAATPCVPPRLLLTHKIPNNSRPSSETNTASSLPSATAAEQVKILTSVSPTSTEI